MPPKRTIASRREASRAQQNTSEIRTRSSSARKDTDNDEILKGFSIQKNTTPLVFNLPFQIENKITIEIFENELLPICDQIFNSSGISPTETIRFSHTNKRMIASIAKTNYLSQAYEMLCQKISYFCDQIPNFISHVSNSLEIGQFWITIEEKIYKMSLLYGPLSYGSTSIPDYFSQCCSNAFQKNVDIFKHASMLVIADYNQARQNGGNIEEYPALTDASHFLKETGLFQKVFIPLFIDSVIEYIEPIINRAFEGPFNIYLHEVAEIMETEEKLAKVFDYYNCISRLNNRINQLVFSSKITQIYDKCLRPLLTEQDIDSVWTCSKFARSTSSFDSFIREMALLFEEEAINCFKTEDPIKHLLVLYKSLTQFCEKSCGPQSTRTVRLAFERGFNSEQELVARLLALSVNKFFLIDSQKSLVGQSKKIKTKNGPSKCEKLEENSELLNEIDQYVALFRMLSLNDVFETYHTQLLTRRILNMNDQSAAAEQYFITKMKNQCGAEYTNRMETLLNDRAQSKELMITFRETIMKNNNNNNNEEEEEEEEEEENENKSKRNDNEFFTCIVLSSQVAKAWSTLNTVQMKPPKSVSKILSKFANHYRNSTTGHNLAWNLQLTTVKLKCDGFTTLKKIKCSGDLATILIALTTTTNNARKNKNKKGNKNNAMNLKKIAKIVEGNEEDVLTRINILKSKKSSKIVIHNREDDSYRINKECTTSNNYLKLPFVIPQLSENDEEKIKSNIIDNRDNQLDAAIVSVAKVSKSIEKDFLYNKITVMVRFKVKREFFETRLSKLATKEYVKIDPSGKVHYVPS